MSTHNCQLSTVNCQPSNGVFITFSGNCKKALTFYQSCFGGRLNFETFDNELLGFKENPVISGSLISDYIIIHGSDLVHNEGRKIGNYLSIFLHCKNIAERRLLIDKLESRESGPSARPPKEENLIEITDSFGVTWVLGL